MALLFGANAIPKHRKGGKGWIQGSHKSKAPNLIQGKIPPLFGEGVPMDIGTEGVKEVAYKMKH